MISNKASYDVNTAKYKWELCKFLRIISYYVSICILILPRAVYGSTEADITEMRTW